MDIVLFFLPGVLTLICSLALWGWLLMGFRSDGWRRSLAQLAAQVAVVLGCVGALRGGLQGAIGALLFPPLLLFDRARLGGLLDTMGVYGVIPCVGAGLVLLLAVRGRAWRRGALVLAGGVLISATVIVAELTSRHQICAAAATHDVVTVPRRSILWSIRNAGAAYQWSTHAEITAGGTRLAWSYSDQDWYVVPDIVAADAPPKVLRCGPLK